MPKVHLVNLWQENAGTSVGRDEAVDPAVIPSLSPKMAIARLDDT